MTTGEAQPGGFGRHFYSLDVLRGLASLSIVFWHWQHFFYQGTHLGPLQVERQPGYLLFRPFYQRGFLAVDIFFCLSGFIFFWLYSDKISQGRTSLRDFFVLRFSRLYPLHLLTLLLVAAGQVAMMRFFGSFFVYPHNDPSNFVLHLLFASAWGWNHHESFNGPVWSVSIEILLYAMFFLACFFRCLRWWHLVLFLALSLVPPFLGNGDLGRGMLSFFLGGLSYQIFLRLWRRGLSPILVTSAIGVTALLWIVIPLNADFNALYTSYAAFPWRHHLMFHHKDWIGAALLIFTDQAFALLLFPLTVLTLALCEAFRGTLGRRAAFLGHISYSTYMLHFPLQLVLVLAASALAIPASVFYSPWALLLFFCILIPLSSCSYHFLEMPAQKLLRAKFLTT